MTMIDMFRGSNAAPPGPRGRRARVAAWSRAVCLPAAAVLVAGCSGAAMDAQPEGKPTADTQDSVDQAAVHAREEWRKSMVKKALPKEGCYQATEPSGEWTEVPCATPPNVPYIPAHGRGGGGGEIVGDGTDLSSQVSGKISRAEGSFPVVSGVTTVTSNGIANDYTLQLNSNFFTGAPLCKGAKTPANCQGWQQFIYASGSGVVFMQYWLLDYVNACPSGWNTFGSDCFKNSAGTTAPKLLPGTDLSNMTLIGEAGSTDTVAFSSGNGTLFAVSASSIHNLNNSWTTAEFNIVGDANGTEATFNSGSTVVVQTVTDSATTTTSAPSCSSSGFTGETNSLNIVSGSCCPVAGGSPAIQFTESNVAGAKAQKCPLIDPMVPVAFQGTDTSVWIEQNGVGVDAHLGMASRTLPSLVTSPGGGLGLAFQANTGRLWAGMSNFVSDQGLGVFPGTSPSAAVLPNGNLVVAFEAASTQDLWLDNNGVGADQHLEMSNGTNPSIAVTPNGQIVVAVQSEGGELWLEQNGVVTDQNVAMMNGSSPSVAVLPNGQVVVAYQASNGDLWVRKNGVGTNQNLGMKAHTSPSLAVLTNGDIYVAFQANTGNLWLDRVGLGFRDERFGMDNASSPTIKAIENGGYQIAFQANTGNLWLDVNGAGTDQKLAMAAP